MLFAVDFDENLIDVEGVAIASVLAFQSACINGTEFDAPETDRLAADGDASFSQEIFDIAMAEIEAMVEPDGIGNDIWREPVALVYIHAPILSILVSLLGNTASTEM